MPFLLTALLPKPLKTLLQKGRRAVREQTLALAAKRRGIVLAPPNFLFQPLAVHDVIVDVGCGHDADFSLTLLNRYPGTRAFALDPTKKHAASLQTLAETSAGRLRHIPVAVATQAGEIIFHESEQNESGSTQSTHINIRQDSIQSYPVKAVHLRDIPRLIQAETIQLIKLDIEGEEYPLIQALTREDLSAYQQLFIEFHHRQIADKSEQDTERAVQKFHTLGFEAFTTDRINYLFYRKI